MAIIILKFDEQLLHCTNILMIICLLCSTEQLCYHRAGFYLLSVGLLAGIVVNLINHHKPETTLWGVVISLVSIAVMVWLMNAKRKVGKQLNSEPIIADSNCTMICVYMSLVLLASSLIYELTGFAYADVIGAAGLIYFSVSEGKEAFEMSKGKECSCGHCETK